LRVLRHYWLMRSTLNPMRSASLMCSASVNLHWRKLPDAQCLSDAQCRPSDAQRLPDAQCLPDAQHIFVDDF